MGYTNGSTLSVDKAISTNYQPVSGLLEDLVGSVEPPFIVSLSVVAAVPTSSRVDVKMNRSGPNHAEIVVEMGEEWNYSSNHGEWRRAVRAIAAYLFSTTSRHDALHWMKYIDEHTGLDDFHYSNDPYNC